MFELVRSQKFQNCLFVLACLTTVVYFSYNILYEANWILGDNHQNWSHTAIGKPFIFFGVNPELQRFFPLAFMDYNILLLFLDAPGALAHYIWNVITFVVFAIVFAWLLKMIEKDNHFSYSMYILPIYFISIFFVPDFMLLFMEVIFPERMMIIAIAIFLLCYYKALQTDNPLFFLLAFIAGVIATYHKEPFFGALLVIAIFNFLFHYKSMSKNHKIFNLLLMLNAVVFLIIYYVVILSNPSGDGNYATGRYSGDYVSAFRVIFHDNILSVSLVLGVVRAFLILLLPKKKDDSFFDSTLYAGLAYAFAFVALKMPVGYYIVPAVVLIAPAMFYWLLRAYKFYNIIPLFLTFCAIIFMINDVKHTQNLINYYRKMRETHMYQVEKIAELYNKGYKFIYVELPLVKPENNFVGETMRSYSMLILQYALNFLNKIEHNYNQYFRVKEQMIDNYIDNKTIIFYPLQNNLEHMMSDNMIKILDDNYHSPVVTSYSIQVYYPLSLDIYQLLYENDISKLDVLLANTKIRIQNIKSKLLLITGWFGQEGIGRWTDGTNANLVMKVAQDVKGIKLTPKYMFIPPNGALNITVFVNGIQVLLESYTQPVSELDIPLPQKVIDNLLNDNVIHIELQMPNVTSPKEAGVGEDTRKLGIYLTTIEAYGGPTSKLPDLPVDSKVSSTEFDTKFFYKGGWSGQEDWGRWTDGTNAELTIKVTSDVKGVKLRSNMFMPGDSTFDLNILVNSTQVLSESYTQPVSEINIPLPQEVINNLANNNIINIELQMPNVASPKELGLSEDSRKLGIGLQEFEIY